jgi:hypothetical protein
MRKRDLEILLRKAGTIAREQHFIVFGSQAIWGLLKRVPEELTVSLEADLYPRSQVSAVPLIDSELGRRSRFFRANGFYADCVTPELATFPNGWEGRLIPLANKNTGGVTGWCVDLHDLVISKLLAGRKKDLDFVGVLLKKKLVSAEILRERLADTAIAETRRSSLMKQVNCLPEPSSRRRKG